MKSTLLWLTFPIVIFFCKQNRGVMSTQYPSRPPLLHLDTPLNKSRAIEAGRDSQGSSPAHQSMISIQERLKSSVKSTFSKMFQLFYTVGASDTSSKAPNEETSTCSPKESDSVSQAVPVRKPGYNPEHLQLVTHTGLGTRLREAWKSALPPRE